jgi:hypothetical protein
MFINVYDLYLRFQWFIINITKQKAVLSYLLQKMLLHKSQKFETL